MSLGCRPWSYGTTNTEKDSFALEPWNLGFFVGLENRVYPVREDHTVTLTGTTHSLYAALTDFI